MTGMVKVTPLQSVRLFGWFDQPRDIVMWDDIAHRKLSWNKLRYDFGFSAAQLATIQPDKKLWIDRGGVRAEDAPDMTTLGVNPIVDLNMDLGEVWRMKWSADTLIKMNVTYEQLHNCGLTPQIMPFFDLSLNSWYKLGFNWRHVEHLNPGLSFKLFGMPHKELLAVLKGFDSNESTETIHKHG